MDLVQDCRGGGRRPRTFNVVDALTPERLAIEVGVSLPARRAGGRVTWR
jgi:hypothetical protein